MAADVGFGTVGEHRIEIRPSISQDITQAVLESPGTIPVAEESIESLANLDIGPLLLTPNGENIADFAIGIPDTSAHGVSSLQQDDQMSPDFSAFLTYFLSNPSNHSSKALVSTSPVDAASTPEMMHEQGHHAHQVILSPKQQVFPDVTFTSSTTSAPILSDSMQALREGSQASWSQSGNTHNSMNILVSLLIQLNQKLLCCFQTFARTAPSTRRMGFAWPNGIKSPQEYPEGNLGGSNRNSSTWIQRFYFPIMWQA